MQNTDKIRKKSGIYGKQTISFYIMLLPFLLLFTVFTVIPAIVGIIASFTDFNGLTMPSFVGIQNYSRLIFRDPTFLIVFKNTLQQALIVGPVGFILSFTVAWLINELSKTVRLIIIFLFYSPTFSGSLYVIFKYVFANDSNGLINTVLGNIGIEPVSWLSNSAYTMTVVIIVSLWMSFGAGFLSFVAGFKGLDHAFYEAAAIDGLKNRWQELYYVTLPQMGPQILFGAVQSIAASFGVGAVNSALTGYPSTDNATDTIVLYMGEYGSTRFEFGYAAAMSVILALIMMLLYRLIRTALKSFSE